MSSKLSDDWERLTEEQRKVVKAIRDRMCQYLIAETKAFYKDHPEVQLTWGLMVDAVINGKPDTFRHTMTPEAAMASMREHKVSKTPVSYQTNKPDTVHASTLPYLTTQELIDIHNNRRKHLNEAGSVLFMRMLILEKAEKENEALIRLLQECEQALTVPTYQAEIDTSKLQALLARIRAAFEAHEELHGSE